MTIAAGFVYDDGVLLCADSQFTVGYSKADGMKLGRFNASWGTVMAAIAGNVDFATSAFQKCERESESKDAKENPLEALEEILKEFYRYHVFGHPKYSEGEYDYSLLLAIRIKGERAKLYRTQETALREIKAFDCAGSGEDSARDLLRFLYGTGKRRDYAIALAAYVLKHVKEHIQYCGGPSLIWTLGHNGQVDETAGSSELAVHIDSTSCWFVCEAQKFILNHVLGDKKTLEKAVGILATRIQYIVNTWESRKVAQSDPQSTIACQPHLPPWPE
jgi:20S proteasome alpha/beta subunit